jgi:hypothetical protein
MLGPAPSQGVVTVAISISLQQAVCYLYHRARHTSLEVLFFVGGASSGWGMRRGGGLAWGVTDPDGHRFAMPATDARANPLHRRDAFRCIVHLRKANICTIRVIPSTAVWCHNSRVSLQFTAVLKPFLHTCTRPKGTLLSVRMTTFSTGQPMTRTCSIGLDRTNVSSFHDSRASDCRLCYVGNRNGSGQWRHILVPLPSTKLWALP